MDLLGVVLAFLTGLVVGALVAYVRSSAAFRGVETERFTLEKRLESAEADRARLSQEVEESKARERGLWEKLREETCRRAAAEENARRVHELENRVAERDKELLELSSRLADLQARLDEERKGIEEKTALLRDAQLILQDTFRTVAAEALQLNNQAFLQLATENLERFHQGAQMDLEIRRKAVDELVRRIEDGLSRLQAKLDELEQERVSSHSALNQRIQDLLEVHLQLRSETANLVKALRQPAARGRWGELQLRRVVEIAGMQPYCDFVEQASTEAEEGRLRPDLVVNLPGGGCIVVDAKAPVDAYLNAVEAADDEERRRFLIQHAAQVRSHMAQLGRKSYFEQFKAAPDFVVMFIPGEAFFSAALEFDPNLIEFGVEQRVIAASPTTLIALLKTVAYGWRQEALARNGQQVAELGRDLYIRIMGLGDHWKDVGKRLAQAVEAYNRSVGTLEHRVLVSARRFADLKAAPEGQLLPELEPLEAVPRAITAPELLGAQEPRALEMPERTDDS